MKYFINKIAAKFGYKVIRAQANKPAREQSNRTDSFLAQKQLFNDINSDIIIFDVGAYVGSVAKIYSTLFPKSQIYCFEPYPDSFLKLANNTREHSNIHCFNVGLSDVSGYASFQNNTSAPTNSLLKTNIKSKNVWDEGLLETKDIVQVETITLDDFVAKHQFRKIDILKMDVQGAEFMVLKGGKNTLDLGLINMIYTEIIMLPTYEGQIPFEETISLIRSFGFELFNLYNYSYTKKGQLRQVDAIFIKTEH